MWRRCAPAPAGVAPLQPTTGERSDALQPTTGESGQVRRRASSPERRAAGCSFPLISSQHVQAPPPQEPDARDSSDGPTGGCGGLSGEP